MEAVGQLSTYARGVDVISGAHEGAAHQPFARQRAVILGSLAQPRLVNRERLAQENGAIAGSKGCERRGLDLTHFSAQRGQYIHRGLDAGSHLRLGLHISSVEVADHADAQPFDAPTEASGVPARGAVGTARITS